MKLEQDRRMFLKASAAFAAISLLPCGCATRMPAGPQLPLSARGSKKPGVVRGAFFFPSSQDVLDGKCEDSWSSEKWFTWPGNQFEPEQQQVKFMAHLRGMAGSLGLDLKMDNKPICTNAGIQTFLDDVNASKPDALLLVNFWNSFSGKLKPLLDNFKGPIILYQPVGANHQLPPKIFREAERVQYIHSVENWHALERGLRAVNAKTRLAQSRLLRVSGKATEESDAKEDFLGVALHTVPAEYFNRIFDEMPVSSEVKSLARSVRSNARMVTDLEEKAFTDGVRAHLSVLKMVEQYKADAITIECLFLKHRKPCLSFSMNNGNLLPCGCENDLNASLSLMFGANLFGRGGFQHNPDFDTENNLYYASHCTCTTQLHGPGGKQEPYDLRPFFHQMPKSLAVDVEWPVGESVTLCKYHTGKVIIDAWQGTIVASPKCPPTGGCATRLMVKMPNVADVCSIYPGPHPAMYCGEFAQHVKVFGKLYGIEVKTNC